MITSRNKNGLASAIAVVLMVLVAGVAAMGGYYFSASSSAKLNQSNPNEITITSTIVRTVTVTQGQTGINNAVLNMTYFSSCVSYDNSCSGSGYVIIFKNTGDSVVSGGTVQIYFGNGTSIYGQTSCTFDSTILPQYSYSCNGSTPSKVPAYSSVLLSIVYPNGKSYSYPYTAPSGITLTSDTLYASGSFQFALNNLGAQTLITQVVLTSGRGESVSLGASSITIGGTLGDNTVNGHTVSSVTVSVPTTATNWALTSGQTYGFVITFQNGQSITGSSIAQ